MRKKVLALTLALAMALALLPGAALAAEGTYVTTYQFYDMNGERISEESFESYAYSWDADGKICWPVAVKKDGKWGYMNDKGEMAIDFQYENAKSFREGLAPVKIDGKWGFIDETGKTVIQPAYDTANSFDGNGCAWVGLGTVTLVPDFDGYYEEFEGKYGLIDKTGKVILPAEYASIQLFGYKDGTAFYEGRRDEGSQYYYGLADQTGKVILPAEYSDIRIMDNGYLSVRKDGERKDSSMPPEYLYGMADENGKLVLPLAYSDISILDDSHVTVAQKGEPDKETGRRSTFCGIADLTGKLVVPVEYNKIEKLDDGLYTVTKKDESGKDQYTVVDGNGKTVTSGEGSPDYQGEGIFRIGSRQVEQKVGQATESIYCDETGKEIQIPAGYYAAACSDGLIEMSPIDRSDVCASFVDKTGKVVLTVNKEGGLYTEGVTDVWSFTDGLAPTKMVVEGEHFEGGHYMSDLWGYMDRTGKMAIPAEYYEVRHFENGLAKVRGKERNEWGVINTEGKVVVPLEYGENAIKFVTGSSYSSGAGMTRALVQVPEEGGTYAIYNGDGEKLAGGSTREYSPYLFSYGEQTMVELSVEGGKLLLDSEGKKVVDVVYDYMDRGDEAIVIRRTVDGESQYAAYSPEWKEIVPFGRYSNITRYGEGLRFEENGKYGMMDLTGKVIVPAKYDDVHMDEGIATGSNWGKGEEEKDQTAVYNMEGKEILPLGEYSASSYAGLIIVSTREFIPPQVAAENPQTVKIDGKDVSFAMYTPDNGETNYIRLRDLAVALNGTAGQYNVGYDEALGQVLLTAGEAYEGPADVAPFHEALEYEKTKEATYVNGKAVELEALRFEHNNLGYTYYKIRDLGEALGFNVGWDNDTQKIYIESDKAYDPNN